MAQKEKKAINQVWFLYRTCKRKQKESGQTIKDDVWRIRKGGFKVKRVVEGKVMLLGIDGIQSIVKTGKDNSFSNSRNRLSFSKLIKDLEGRRVRITVEEI